MQEISMYRKVHFPHILTFAVLSAEPSVLFIRLTFEEQRVLMLSDICGRLRCWRNQENFGGRLLCWAIKMPSGSASQLPFHVVFHLGGNICGILSFLAFVNGKTRRDQSVFEQLFNPSAISGVNKGLLSICAITFECGQRSPRLFICQHWLWTPFVVVMPKQFPALATPHFYQAFECSTMLIDYSSDHQLIGVADDLRDL